MMEILIAAALRAIGWIYVELASASMQIATLLYAESYRYGESA
jgi:hypothetical protein